MLAKCDKHEDLDCAHNLQNKVMFMPTSECLFSELASLSTIAGGAADPAADSSNLGIDRWVVGATATHSPGGHTNKRASNSQGATRVSIAGSLAAIVYTDHKVAVEAAAPPGDALRVGDDGHRVNSLKGGGKTAGSTGAAPSSDSSVATRVVRAGHDGGRGDVAARGSAAGPHNRKVIGSEARAGAIAGMLKHKI